jgi:hypothetical protein
MDIWNELTDSFNKDMAIDEMRKKYENTYLILIKEDGTETLVMYKQFHDGFHYFKDELNIDIKLRHETKTRIVCAFPERRLFNADKLALEFIRRPVRQYKRGICKENVSIYSPIRHLWGQENHPWTPKTIQQALYPVYPASAKEAIEKLNNKECVSIALNDKFMLSLSITRGYNGFYLWYCNKCIGTFHKEVFKIEHKLFTQEVLDNITLFKPYHIEL